MKLTDRTANKPELPAGKTDLIVFDEDISGFGLRIREGGSRAWIFQYSHSGRTRRITLGPWPKISAATARQLVEQLAAKVALGFDPAAEKAQHQAHKETLGEVVELYLKLKTRELKPRTFVESFRYLSETAKILHNRPLSEVAQSEIANLLTKVATDSGDATANRLRSNLSALFTWSMQQGKLSASPITLTEKRKEVSRDRVLKEPELAAIWNALPDSDYGKIVKLLMLTGCRRDEIGGLRWSEIDLDKGEINLPAERTKNGKPHTVPMSATARAILAAQPRERDYVFGRGNGGFSGWSASKAALDAALKMADWRLHDLRRTCATGMADLGVLPHVIEAALNHISGHKAGVAGIYNRGNYHKERREALDQWAAHLAAVVASDAPPTV
jgi:integrase